MRKISEKKRKRKRRSSSDIMDEFIDESLRPESSPRKRKRRSSSSGQRKRKVRQSIEMPDIVDESLLETVEKPVMPEKSQSVKTEAVIHHETRRSRIRQQPAENEYEDTLRDRPYDKKKKSSFVDGLIGVLLIAVFISMVIFYVKVDRAEVISGSMEPTLMTNEKVVIINGRSPKRFQMVVFYPPDGSKDKYVKRVIGLPGDTVEYRDDVLYVNGEMYEEPYLDQNREAFEAESKSETDFYTKDLVLENIPGVSKGTKKIPKDMYLVLGDNRQNSQDSRYIGLIPKDNLVGIVWKKAQEPKKITK